MKKIKIKTDLLKKAMVVLQNGCNPNAIIPVIENIHFDCEEDKINLMVTEMEVAIKYTIVSVDEMKTEPCKFLVAFYQLQKILPNYKDEYIEFSVLKTKVDISIGGEVYECKMNSKPEEFPVLADMDNSLTTEIGDIIPFIKRAVKTISEDSLRPAMCCVCVQQKGDDIHIASTDARVLYSYEVPAGDMKIESPVLFNSKAIKAISALPDSPFYELKQDEKKYSINTPVALIVITKTIGKFPDYESIIPIRETNVNISRRDLIGLFTKCSLNTHPAKETELAFKPDAIEFKTVDSFKGLTIEGSVPAIVSGEIQSCLVNASAMLKVLSQSDSENIMLSVGENNKAIVLKEDPINGYTGIIMPLLMP